MQVDPPLYETERQLKLPMETELFKQKPQGQTGPSGFAMIGISCRKDLRNRNFVGADWEFCLQLTKKLLGKILIYLFSDCIMMVSGSMPNPLSSKSVSKEDSTCWNSGS